MLVYVDERCYSGSGEEDRSRSTDASGSNRTVFDYNFRVCCHAGENAASPRFSASRCNQCRDDLRVYRITESTSGVNGVAAAADGENSEDESCGLPAT